MSLEINKVIEEQGRDNWDYFDNNETLEMSSEIRSISCSSENKNIAVAVGYEIQIYDTQTGKQFGDPLIGRSESVVSIQYSGDNTLLVSGSYDQTVRLWNAHSRQQIDNPIIRHTDFVISVVFLKDQQFIASASLDRSIRIWDVHTRVQLQCFISTSCVFAIHQFNKIFVSSHQNGSIILWNLFQAIEHKIIIKSQKKNIYSVKLSPNGKIIASGAFGNSIKIWSTSTRKLINHFNGHEQGITAMGWGLVGIRSTSPLAFEFFFAFENMSFSPDSDFLVSGSWDNSVKLWNIPRRSHKILRGHNAVVNSVEFSFDGRYVISGCNGHILRVQQSKIK